MPKSSKFAFAKALVFEYIGKYKAELAMLSLVGVSQAIFDATIPFIIGGFLDAILDVSKSLVLFDIHAPLWAWFLVGYSLVQVAASILGWVHETRGRKLGTKIHANYMYESTVKLMKMPMSFHKEEKAGVVWDRVIRASRALTNVIERVLVRISPQMLSVVAGFIIALNINTTLSFIILAGITLYVLTLIKIVRPLVVFQRSGQKAWNRAFERAYRVLMSVQTVKQSTSEDYEDRAISSRYLRGAVPKWNKVETVWANIAVFQRVLVVVTQVAVFIVSVYFITRGELTVGGLIAFNGYANMVFAPFMMLGYNWETIQNGLVEINRAEKLVRSKPEIFEPKGTASLDVRGGIEFDKVRFRYSKDDPEVLRGVSFKVKPGQKVALVGESGVGKTTIAELISAYYFPEKGSVSIDGLDTKKIRLSELRDEIAVVPQEVTLFNDTIEFNLRYGNFKATKKQVRDAAKQAYADGFIKQFKKGYRQLVGERGVKLSVGQKQRVAIARAILRDPKILILDEPTSALDAQTEKDITESLERLMEGRTTVIIAHRLSTVRKADKILVFDKGRLAEQGTHKELVNKKGGVYRKLYDLHIGLE